MAKAERIEVDSTLRRPFRVPIGARVRDRITGVEGVVVARTEYLRGCNRYSVQQAAGKNGEVPAWHMCEEDDCEVLQTPLEKRQPPAGNGPG